MTEQEYPIGKVYGDRKVLDIVRRNAGGRPEIVSVRCQCGRVDDVEMARLSKGRGGRCRPCAEALRDAKRKEASAARWRELVGKQVGLRKVLAYAGLNDDNRHLLKVQCGCGRVDILIAGSVHRTRGCKACMSGRNNQTGPKREPAQSASNSRAALLMQSARECPEVWRLECTDCGPGVRCARCETQLEAAGELGALAGGMSLGDIAVMLGLSRERIRQIEAAAMAKLAEAREAAAVWADAREVIEERDSGSWGAWSDSAEAVAGDVDVEVASA